MVYQQVLKTRRGQCQITNTSDQYTAQHTRLQTHFSSIVNKMSTQPLTSFCLVRRAPWFPLLCQTCPLHNNVCPAPDLSAVTLRSGVWIVCVTRGRSLSSKSAPTKSQPEWCLWSGQVIVVILSVGRNHWHFHREYSYITVGEYLSISDNNKEAYCTATVYPFIQRKKQRWKEIWKKSLACQWWP